MAAELRISPMADSMVQFIIVLPRVVTFILPEFWLGADSLLPAESSDWRGRNLRSSYDYFISSEQNSTSAATEGDGGLKG